MSEWNAEDYRAHSAAQSGWAKDLMNGLSFRGDESILDLGCGDGRNTAVLAGMVSRGIVIGIDRSPSMVSLAAGSVFCKEHPNLAFLRGDLRTLPFRSSFDLVFSNAVLHWIPDQLPVLREVASVLKPLGRVVFQMGGRGNAADILRIADGLIRETPWRDFFVRFSLPFGFFGPDEYESWMREAGLTPVRTELIPRDMVQKGREDLEGWIRTTWHPYLNRLPLQRQPAFIREIAARYHRRFPPDPSGFYHIRMVRLEVEAEKRA